MLQTTFISLIYVKLYMPPKNLESEVDGRIFAYTFKSVSEYRCAADNVAPRL